MYCILCNAIMCCCYAWVWFSIGKGYVGKKVRSEPDRREDSPRAPPPAARHQILHGAVRGWVGSPQQQSLHPQAVSNG